MRPPTFSPLCRIIAAALTIFEIGTNGLRAQESPGYFVITVVDQETGRGVPMVEVATSSHQRYYTDSNGIIALDDPTLMRRRLFVSVSSDGYQRSEGVSLAPRPGRTAEIRLHRSNVAERLYRITGQDIYGASARIGRPVPIKHQGLNGGVTGQDTFIDTPYKGKLVWFWGDTKGLDQFNGKASGATSDLPRHGGLDPGIGIDLDYFTNPDGFSKQMCPFGGPVLVWIQWLTTAPDERGNERLFALYKCIKNDGKPGEAGFAVFNDSARAFEPFKVINEWYGQDHRSGHPARVMVNGKEYLYIINYSGCERVEADVAQFTDPSRYERFTCFGSGSSNAGCVDRDSFGTPIYRWRTKTEDFNRIRQEAEVKAGTMKQEEGLWQFQDVESGKPAPVDAASVFWNSYRKRWVMIAYEFTGGVWYFEGDTPTGPWVYGRKIVSHEHYDFYNVGQHPEFDQDGGRLIYFEGTYTTGFSGNTNPTPLYDYNQMMYRLDLADDRLALPCPVYHLRDGRHLMREAIDSLDLWNRIDRIPFFALESNRRTEECIPVYVEHTLSGERLTMLKTSLTTQAVPIFFALPATSAPDSLTDPVSGTWKCTAKMGDGSTNDFEIDLQKRGTKVTGTYVTRGLFSNGTLDLELEILDYRVRGRMNGGSLLGDFEKTDGTESGTWSGDRVNVETTKESPATARLFEYSNSDGQFLYSVDSTLASRTLKRNAVPICRVWRNPSSVIALDSEARPTPEDRHGQ